MQRKLLAIAVGSALGVPTAVLAQTSTVQVFGTMYIEYTMRAEQGDALAGGDLSKADFIQTPGSEIGFKGEEKLGGGLSAWFQCTSTADPRGQSQDGWCSRNSALGLKGNFGNVFIGNWDSPFKRTISPNTVGGNDTGIWGTAFLISSNSTTVAVGGSRTTFKRRQNNSINYDSPNFGGFQVMAMFTSSQPSTGTLSGATNNKPRVFSIGGQYSAGPLFVSAGWERLDEFGGALAFNTKDDAWHIGAAYRFGPVRVGGQYTRQEWDVVGGEAKASAWHIGVDWRIAGPHGLRAAFTQARDMSGVTGAVIAGAAAAGPGYRPAVGGDTGADLWQIRYVYTFSKRTEFNIGYVRLNNDDNAAYNLGGLNAAHEPGDNQSAIALAVRHRF